MEEHLQAFVEDRARELAGDVSVYVKFLRSGRTVRHDASRPVETMSVIKIGIFIELAIAAESDPGLLEAEVAVSAEDVRLGTGVLRALTSAKLSLANMAMLMMTVSDNTATDLCIRALGGPDAVNARLAANGYPDLRLGGWAAEWFRALAVSMDASGLYGTLSDGEIAARGYPIKDKRELLEARRRFSETGTHRFGTATADELGRFLESAWRGRYGSRAASRRLLDAMSAVEQRSRIARSLDTADVYSKSGSFFPHVVNDVGIVDPDDGEPFVIAVLISQFNGRLAVAEEAIGAVTERCAWAARDQVERRG